MHRQLIGPQFKQPYAADVRFLRMAACGAVMLWLVACLGCHSFTTWNQTAELPMSDAEAELRFEAARSIERHGTLQDASEIYQKLVQAIPDHVPSLHRLGILSLKREDPDQALEYFHRAAAIGTPSSELLGDLGYTQFLIGDLSSARKTLQQALVTDPENHRVRNNLALVLGSQGQIDECLVLFRHSCTEAESLANVGVILTQTGDLEQAKRYFHDAIRIDPQLESAARGLLAIQEREHVGSPPQVERTATLDRREPAVISAPNERSYPVMGVESTVDGPRTEGLPPPSGDALPPDPA